jgi:hypothetical protein
VCHAGRPPHQRIGYAVLKNVRHALRAGYLMSKDRGRTFTFGATHFAPPYADSFTQTARRVFEPQVIPVGCTERIVESRLTVEAIEIGADELAVLHANAGIVNQKGHAARGIDLIVGTARGTRFRLDNLNAVLKCLSRTRMRANRAYGERSVT